MSGERHIEIEVVADDALRREVDALVLKHAQISLGVDAAVKERLGLDLDMDLSPGRHLLLEGGSGLGAEHVVFLGVPPLHEFGYGEIRLFARRALALVGEELPDAREVGLTLHGAGYGLDETACFGEEIAGLFDAFQLGTVSDALERVLIIELDPGRAERLGGYLEDVLPQWRGVSRNHESSPPVTREKEPALGAGRDHVFVAMPFAEEFEDRFHYGISAAVHSCGLLCERIDQTVFTGNILARMKESIRTAKLVVADLTDANPNVYLEVGFAWASGVPTVLVHHADSELKFDVQSERCIGYKSIKDLETRLTGELRALLP